MLSRYPSNDHVASEYWLHHACMIDMVGQRSWLRERLSSWEVPQGEAPWTMGGDEPVTPDAEPSLDHAKSHMDKSSSFPSLLTICIPGISFVQAISNTPV